MKTRIEYIDWAKGYAIFTIVCYHALQRAGLPPVLQQGFVFGGTGVHLFFLLSGFGLGLSQFSDSLLQFYRRRLTKVWLPYVLALTISLLAAIFFRLFPDGFDAWLAGVGLYQMFSERYIESFGGHFWFISTIIQFYIAYPALLWIKSKLSNNRFFFALSLALSVAWWLLVYFLEKGGLRTWNSCFLQFLWEFGLGMVLADFLNPTPDPSPTGRGDVENTVERTATYTAEHSTVFSMVFSTSPLPVGEGSGVGLTRANWWLSLPIALVFTALMALMILKMGEAGRIFNDIPALIGYAAFSVFFFQIGNTFFPPLKRFFLWVGGFSFSLYLVHIVVLEIWLRILESNCVPVNWLSLLPFILLALPAGRTFEPLSRWWVALWRPVFFTKTD